MGVPAVRELSVAGGGYRTEFMQSANADPCSEIIQNFQAATAESEASLGPRGLEMGRREAGPA